MQISLANNISKIINKPVIINYKTNGNYIDIAFEMFGKKLAVEYDSWYIHNSHKKQEQDEKRMNSLIRNGWKVLVIKSDGLLPTNSELQRYINKLRYSDKTNEIIIMSDWGNDTSRRFEKNRKLV